MQVIWGHGHHSHYHGDCYQPISLVFKKKNRFITYLFDNIFNIIIIVLLIEVRETFTIITL